MIVFVGVERRKKKKTKGKPHDKSNFSRLIIFPFSAHTTFHKSNKEWYFETDYPKHNHPASEDPQAHVGNCRLTSAHYPKVKNLPQALKPAKIL
ncbi:hypothetical protein VP01_481g7 [Puccinia sorghi]|uniref:Uncharacterized protein n=1 Tax=Puccinia sorghi TaxID=27349 RepID=A0A0L6UMJ7_9BASI|nr:hypothetical protein VP01_481g7 [Puccinia sorghi]